MHRTIVAVLCFVPLITACVSQKDIETACLQTLSASTPICRCDAKTNDTPVDSQPGTITPDPLEIKPADTPIAIPSEAITQPPPPQPDDLIFDADFESGDLSAFNGKDGEHFGKGVYYKISVVDTPAEGNYSAALTIGSGQSTAAYLFTYNVPSTLLGYYSADYYVPHTLATGDWWNVWQWKSQDVTFDKPIIDLNILKDNGTYQVVMNYVPGGSRENPTQPIYQTEIIPFPPDKWVNITGYYYATSDETGYVEIYQDGVKIFELRDFQTKPSDANVLWSVNSYASEIFPNPATCYVDNIKVGEIYR